VKECHNLKAFGMDNYPELLNLLPVLLELMLLLLLNPILPYALSFAAGAMIFVVVEELIPESQRGENTDLATLGLMVGFTVMMVLDVAFGS